MVGAWFTGFEVVVESVNALPSFGLTGAVFAFIYKFMPRVTIQWRDVWLGAAVTTLLFTLGKTLIGYYVGKTGVASSFGAAGSLIVLLVWVYYSAQVSLMGAEFTWVYARTYGFDEGAGRRGCHRAPRRITRPRVAACFVSMQHAAAGTVGRRLGQPSRTIARKRMLCWLAA